MAHPRMKRMHEEIQAKLRLHDSFNFLANIIVKLYNDRRPDAVLPGQMLDAHKSPTVGYLCGLFLSSSSSGRPGTEKPDTPDVEEFLDLLFRYAMAHHDSADERVSDAADDMSFVEANVLHEKILGQNIMHGLLFQQDLIEDAFTPLGDHFVSRYGFSPREACEFAAMIMEDVDGRIAACCKDIDEMHMHYLKEQIDPFLAEPETNPDSDGTAYAGVTDAQWGALFGMSKYKHTHPYIVSDLGGTFMIEADRYCAERRIANRDGFRAFLEAFSCSFGDQYAEFGTSMLSRNIIHDKPVIRVDENRFFVPMHQFLHGGMHLLLENLLRSENGEGEGGETGTWRRYCALKSDHIKNRTYDFLCRIFPAGCVFRDTYCQTESGRIRIDLVVAYDNNAILIKADSEMLHRLERQAGLGGFGINAEALVKDAWGPAMEVAADCLRRGRGATFCDKSGDKIMAKIGGPAKWKLFLLNVNMDHLGSFAANETAINHLGWRPDSSQRPTAIHIDDIDMITHCLDGPAYFLNYLYCRIEEHDPRPNLGPCWELYRIANHLANGGPPVNDNDINWHMQVAGRMMRSMKEYENVYGEEGDMWSKEYGEDETYEYIYRHHDRHDEGDDDAAGGRLASRHRYRLDDLRRSMDNNGTPNWSTHKRLINFLLHGTPKPEMDIPDILKELILNMQEDGVEHHTDAVNVLLDMSPECMDMVKNQLGRISDEISRGLVPNGFAITERNVQGEGYDACISYVTASAMNGFYEHAARHAESHSIKMGKVRHVTIARDASDRRNSAAFVIFHDRSQ